MGRFPLFGLQERQGGGLGKARDKLRALCAYLEEKELPTLHSGELEGMGQTAPLGLVW